MRVLVRGFLPDRSALVEFARLLRNEDRARILSFPRGNWDFKLYIDSRVMALITATTRRTFTHCCDLFKQSTTIRDSACL